MRPPPRSRVPPPGNEVITSALEALGRGTRLRALHVADRLQFVGATTRAALDGAGLRGMGTRVLLNQIRFTAVQALPFLSSIAVMIGLTVMVQISGQAVRFGVTEAVGPILVAVVVRELGPLLTAVVVIGRSGTAIAAELSTNTMLGETEALESMGIDPLQHYVVPRIAGVTVSVMVLTVFFIVITLLVGGMAAQLWGVASIAAYLSSLRFALRPEDVVLTLVKGAIFGGGIAVLCSHAGLSGGKRATAIPQAVTRGVVASLFFVFATSVLFSLVFYL